MLVSECSLEGLLEAPGLDFGSILRGLGGSGEGLGRVSELNFGVFWGFFEVCKQHRDFLNVLTKS